MRKIILSLLAIALTLSAEAQTGHNWEISKNLNIFNNLYKTLDLYYVDTIQAKETIEGAIDYMLGTLDDYTEYYPQNEQEQLKQMLEGKYAGIGALIHYNKKKERCMVYEPYEGFPAAEAGLKPGDIIISIDGKDVGKRNSRATDEYTSAVSGALRGEPGTKLSLVVERLGEEEPITVSIVRRAIKLPSIPYYGIIKNGIGYIYLTQFTENCAEEIKGAVLEMKQNGMTSLVLDLRNNGGGLLREAAELLNLFLPRGKKIVETKGRIEASNSSYYTQKEPIDTKLPIVVLVNGRSASASEITAGAFQDYDRAVIIGAQTFGKGLVQQPHNMPYGGTLKLTTSKYYIPSGRCIQKRDYKKRTADGYASIIPDSLSHIFHTTNGREVRDNGGIAPDVKIKNDSLPNLLAFLGASDELVDFVTLYLNNHKDIAPAKDYSFPDEDYAAFKKYIKESGFTYDKQSLKVLETLKRVARFEGYDTSAENEIKALEEKLSHNEDADFDFWKKDIKELINAEIMKRIYFQRGVVRNGLITDKVFDKACDILQNPKEYHKILK